jgi:hypothetical protein
MVETKYGKYIGTDEKPVSEYGQYIIAESKPPSEERKEFAKKRLEIGGSQQILRSDDTWVKGTFYLSTVWIWNKGLTDEFAPQPHTHDWPEYIAFIGTNPDDPYDLGGEIEIWLGDEQHRLTKSCLVFIPAGVKHCPILKIRVDRPIFSFSTGPQNVYKKDPVS